jgi:hypothetical protein
MLVNNVQNAFLYWLVAYWTVTVLGVLLTLIFTLTRHLPSAKQLGVKPSQAPAYLKTVPYHLPMNIPVWLFFAWLFLRSVAGVRHLVIEAILLGIFWLILSLLVDCVAFVLIRHPYSFTWREFYIDYQPWITLIYLVVLFSPLMVAIFLGIM